jgi:hypothetical protein
MKESPIWGIHALFLRFGWAKLSHCILYISHSANYLFNIENLVLRARSEFNGFVGAGANRFGVLEFWSIGVLAKTKARILLEFF